MYQGRRMQEMRSRWPVTLTKRHLARLEGIGKYTRTREIATANVYSDPQ